MMKIQIMIQDHHLMDHLLMDHLPMDHPSNGSSSNDSSPNGLIYGDGSTDIISNGDPIGSYLGPVVGTPMPLLNDFSRFS